MLRRNFRLSINDLSKTRSQISRKKTKSNPKKLKEIKTLAEIMETENTYLIETEK